MNIYVYVCMYIHSAEKRQLLLCLWFRASLIYINNCPTRCNTKRSIYYSASSLYMFRVSTTPIIRRTQNSNYSLRYWPYFFCRIINRLLCVASRWTIINIESFLLSIQAVHIVTTVFWKVKRVKVISLISMKYYYVRMRSSCICLRY